MPKFISSSTKTWGGTTLFPDIDGCSLAQSFEYHFVSQYESENSTCCSGKLNKPEGNKTTWDCKSFNHSEKSEVESYSDEKHAYTHSSKNLSSSISVDVKGTTSHSTKWMPILNIFLSKSKNE